MEMTSFKCHSMLSAHTGVALANEYISSVCLLSIAPFSIWNTTNPHILISQINVTPVVPGQMSVSGADERASVLKVLLGEHNCNGIIE